MSNPSCQRDTVSHFILFPFLWQSAAFPSDSLSMSTDAGLTQLNKAKAPSAGAPQQPRLSQPSISPFNNPFGAAPATTTTTTTAAASNTNAAPSKVVMRQPAAGDSKPGVSPFPGPPSTAAPKRPNSVVIGPGANPFGAPPSTSTPSPKPPANPFAPAEKPASANPFAGSSNTSSKPGSKVRIVLCLWSASSNQVSTACRLISARHPPLYNAGS